MEMVWLREELFLFGILLSSFKETISTGAIYLCCRLFKQPRSETRNLRLEVVTKPDWLFSFTKMSEFDIVFVKEDESIVHYRKVP